MLAHLGALTTKAKVESVPCSPLGSSTRILEANREKWVNHFTLRTIIILMKTIKDLYQTRLARAPAPSIAHVVASRVPVPKTRPAPPDQRPRHAAHSP